MDEPDMLVEAIQTFEKQERRVAKKQYELRLARKALEEQRQYLENRFREYRKSSNCNRVKQGTRYYFIGVQCSSITYYETEEQTIKAD